MTTRETLWFTCPICNRSFLSYVNGKFLYACKYKHDTGLCFYDNEIGEIHDNHYLNCIRDIRKCQRCRKSKQLEDFL